MIVAHALTEPTVDDATIGIDLIETGDDEIARVTADAAYETVAFYEAAEMRDAGIVRLIRLDPKNLQSRTIRLQVDATRPGRRLGLV